MIVTKNNLNQIVFENQDAKLLIQDVVSHTTANLYYYFDTEITVQMALSIWKRAHQAMVEEVPYSVSFLDMNHTKNRHLVAI